MKRTFLGPLVTAAAATETLTAVSPAAVTCEQEKRQITGLIIPFGKEGYTSAGVLTASRGSVKLPADLSRVKLSHGHTTEKDHKIVGYMLAAEEREDGLYGVFQLSDSADATAALAAAKAKTHDGLSVELHAAQHQRRQLITASLSCVAMVAVPAFADARTTAIANQHDQAPEVPAGAATAPAGMFLGGAAAPGTAGPKLADVMAHATRAKIHAVVSPELTAAVGDITTDAMSDAHPPGWLGELWQGATYTQKVVPLLNQRVMRARTLTGFKWVTKPGVDDWDGDLATVPTGDVEITDVQVAIHRLAARHRLAREFFDFGDAEYLESFFRHRASSYLFEEDARAAAFVVDSATALTEGGDPVEAANLLEAVALGVDTVNEMSNSSAASFVLINSRLRRTLIEWTKLSIPEFMGLFGVNPSSFVTHPAVPDNTVIVGAKAALDWWRLPGAPFRVRTTDLTVGGEDVGVFGYYAHNLADPIGLVSVGVAEAPEPEVP